LPSSHPRFAFIYGVALYEVKLLSGIEINIDTSNGYFFQEYALEATLFKNGKLTFFKLPLNKLLLLQQFFQLLYLLLTDYLYLLDLFVEHLKILIRYTEVSLNVMLQEMLPHQLKSRHTGNAYIE